MNENVVKKNNNGIIMLVVLVLIIIVVLVLVRVSILKSSINAVESSMDDSRINVIQDMAKSIASSFNMKYTEALVMDNDNDVYGDILGQGLGYDFSDSSVYEISNQLASELVISKDIYHLGDSDTVIDSNGVKNSFIAFDGDNFTACLVINQASDYYQSGVNKNQTVVINSKMYKFVPKASSGDKDKVMWVCSDGSSSFE